MSSALNKAPEPTTEDFRRIADAIGQISAVGKALLASGLSRRAILVLLHDATGVSMRDIKLILDALPTLRDYYLTRAA